jgi:hypothetical protein
MAIRQIAYTLPDGKIATAAYMTNSAYQLTGPREQFAQLCAQGKSPLDAYCQSHAETLTPENAEEIKGMVSRLKHNTTVVLRIQELQKPVMRKVARKIEFNQEKALEQCQIAWDLAYANGDVKGMLAATKVQAELCKLLVQELTVNHKHGALDEVATAVLIEMQRTIEVRQAKQKAMVELGKVKVESIPPTPHEPLFVDAELVPSGGSTNHSG